MLSRIAESLYWIGRYTARADYVSRIMDAHFQLLLEDVGMDRNRILGALARVMDIKNDTTAKDIDFSFDYMIDELGFNSDNPSSINGALLMARENARHARDAISTELWEELNRAKLVIDTWDSGGETPNNYHEYFTRIRRRVATINGVIQSSFMRSDALDFITLGANLEQADMTSRLILIASQLGSKGVNWMTIMRSCGSHEAYLRASGTLGSDASMAEFLLTNPNFPRSLIFSIESADQCLNRLEKFLIRPNKMSSISKERREIGLAKSALIYQPLENLLATLPWTMLEVQKTLTKVSDFITKKYFPQLYTGFWFGEQL
jgi:uncharacterized alpha-E superfamily protein